MTGMLHRVPAGWTIKKLKHVASLQSGEGITSESIEDEGLYPVYGGNGLRGFTNSFTHQGEFVLIGRQGALCGNVHLVQGQFWASEHAVVGTFYAGDSPRWARHVFEHMNLGQYSVAAAQPGLAVDRIKELPVAVPSVEVQEAIATYLDAETKRIDGLIGEKRRLLTALIDLKSSRISAILTGADEASVPTGNEWLPMIPRGWALKRLKLLGQVRSGLAKGKKHEAGVKTVELPYMRVANVQDGYIDLSDVTLIEVAESEVDRYTLQVGDVLMNEGGDYDKLGRGAMWEGLIDQCLHQNHVFAVRLDDVEWAPWVAAVTRTSYAKFYFMNNSKQSTNLASINQTNVKEFPVVVPPASLRDELLKVLTDELQRIDDLAHHVERELEVLAELRSSTITDAVLGRIDVRHHMKN